MAIVEISPDKALQAISEGRKVYRLRETTDELLSKVSIAGFLGMRFAVDDMAEPEEDALEPKKKAREPKAEKRTGTRKEIDWEKAEALRAAGWPNKAIAEELDTTTASIAAGFHRRKLKAEREKHAEATETGPDEGGPDTAADG